MSFRDNLQHLRDTRDMSQADLAQQLGVSRQSVAKWEAEKSYPEMDKLIKICDLFDCSLDDLVRGDLAGCEGASEEPAAAEELAVVDGSMAANELATSEGSMASEHLAAVVEPTALGESTVSEEVPSDVCGYDDHMRRRAWDYAAGVASVILGLGAGINFTTMGPNVNPTPFIVFLSIGIALAFLLLKPMGKEHRAFLEEHPQIDDFYTPEQKAEARSAKGGAVVGAVAFVIAGLNMPGLFGWFHQYAFAVLAMFGCLALAAALVVYAVMMDRRVDVARYNRLSARKSAAEPEAHAGSAAGDTTAG